jgi:hypothetical protein
MAAFILTVLGEHTAELDLAGLGAAVGLLGFVPAQFAAHDGHAGAVEADVELRQRLGFGRGPHPSGGPGPDDPHQPLNLTAQDVDAAEALQQLLGGLERLQGRRPARR